MMAARSDDLVPVTTVASEFEAGVIVAALREEGIDARQSSSGMQGILGGAAGSLISPALVLVPRGDFDRAKEALARLRDESIDIDWSEVDVGEGESVEEERRAVRRMRNTIVVLLAVAILLFMLWIAALGRMTIV